MLFVNQILVFMPVILGLLLVVLNGNKMSLGKYFAVSLILASLGIGGRFLLSGYNLPSDYVYAFVFLAISMIFTVILTGAIGQKLKIETYASILIFSGLYPWYQGIVHSLLTIIILFLVFSISIYLSHKRGLKAISVKSMSMESTRYYLNSKESQIYKDNSKLYYSNVFLIGALLGFTLNMVVFAFRVMGISL